SFRIMSLILNESEPSAKSTADSEEQGDSASWKQYLERKNLVLQFLSSDLSLQHLQHHRNRAELLQKCSFYLDIEPKYVNVRDRNHVIHQTNILQIIDLRQLQRMKKVGKDQIEINLTLLTSLLDELERGREELSRYIETCDVVSFHSRWDLITKRMSKLSKFGEKLLSLQVAGQLYVKHQLVFPFEGRISPNIRLSLLKKTPLIFDQKESFARKDWAKLKWFTENQESSPERYELYVKLLPNGSPKDVGYSSLQTVTSNTCVVRRLQPARSYKFTITRTDAHMCVFQKWEDSIILETKLDDTEGTDSSSDAS
ncbi:Uncharacterized protein C20orf195, partial [Apaloderma vittatum]